MNVLFLTMVPLEGLASRGIYEDLLRRFAAEEHGVYVVSPRERRLGLQTAALEADGAHFLRVRTLNLQKCSVIEKGIGQVLVEGQFRRAIKQYWKGVAFDLILYSTPPITFPELIAELKKRNPGARSFLLLKDIFPQNAVDLGMFPKDSLLYRFFRRKERKLYRVSDQIGCMSEANVAYVLQHNPELAPGKVCVAPNSIELTGEPLPDAAQRCAVRSRYSLPTDRPVFIYGGNLGKPQGISFLIECLDANADRDDCHFVVVGNGTEYPALAAWQAARKPKAVTLMAGLPKEDYDLLVRSCDVGLIFLDHRFTIPNFPSRLLSYLKNRMPVLVASDPHTDMGAIAQREGFGFWCESDAVGPFTELVDRMLAADRAAMGEKGYAFLKANYLVQNTYEAIVRAHV